MFSALSPLRRIARSAAEPAWRGCLLLGLLALAGVAGAGEPKAGLDQKPLAARSGPRGPTMFAELPATQTGIVTENRYADPRMWNQLHQEFEVGSIGTGVAIADYDGDGRPDLFVVSKTESCRLFRNLGDWKFEDVTDRAGVGDKGGDAGIWKQGVTFADVNNDGRPDIYVCRFNAPNLLYINQGDGAESGRGGVTFKEEAAARGLAVVDGSVMGAFCDYDRDGWLDLFLLTNLLDNAGHPDGQRDYLFHNNGDNTFTNVSDQAGILRKENQGHSATWWDYDNDGWPDLYVANDFAAPDILYRNNHDGTFTNVINQTVPHMPYSAMGADLGDVNNDGLVDFLVAEMAATTVQKDQRSMAASRTRSKEDLTPLAAPQNLRNALYLNTGTGRFQEAAFLTGLAATDWTWSVRWEDLDNDGRLDLHVTNGMDWEQHNADLIARQMAIESAPERLAFARNSPVLAEANLAFRNLGDLRFENVGAAWGLSQKGVSFGAAFGDLDGDGDLDLVYANYRGGVTVLRNDSDTGHSVLIDLRGTVSNRFGVGATVKVKSASGRQVRQLVLARGYLSCSEPVLHFGLGADPAIEELTVNWPGGTVQTFANLSVDRRFTITEPATSAALPAAVSKQPAAQFSEVSQPTGLAWSSREPQVDESYLQRLLPLRYNRRGPSLAVGEITGAGRDEAVIGGTALDPLRILLSTAPGSFRSADAAGLAPTPAINDGPVLLFDADGDGKNDLLVTKGGNTQPAGAPEYQPRLWLNDGHGGFRPAVAAALPALPINAGAVAAADFDHSGRLGLFIGGRIESGAYPLPPPSALLANRGGHFEDVTDTFAPGLGRVGMVTSALWTDVDGDGWADLLLALEWGPIKYFHNNAGRGFEDRTEQAGFAAAGTGWWNALATADFNGDGQPDYVAGNLGLNTQYHASPEQPALLFSGDFKGDGSTQLIEARSEDGKIHPWRTRKDLGALIPSILKRFPKNDFYARATLGEILGEDKLAAAERLTATEFSSGVFLSQPDGKFKFCPWPRIAQIAPVQGLVAGDFDGDSHADICVVQNSYAPVPLVGRFDGGLGQLLRGDGRGNFAAVPPAESGLLVPGDAKALAVLDLNQDGWPDFLVTQNNGPTLAFQNHGIAGRQSLRIALRGRPGNPTAVGARITVELSDGTKQTSEVQAGSGYASQSTAACFFGYPEKNPPRLVNVRWPSGRTTRHEIPAATTMLTLGEPGQ